MNCPYCKKEMMPGYIQCRDGLTWTQHRQPIPALSSLALLWDRESIPLSNEASEKTHTVQAYRCANCQKVIIDYAGQHRPAL